jgi:hypothetical protein
MRNGSRAQRGEAAMINGHDADPERRELAQLYREQDKLLAEAKVEREYKELMQRADENGIIRRDAPAPEPAVDWSNWENWLQGHQNILKAEILDWVLDNVPAFVCTYVREKLDERDHKIAGLEAELVECKGLLGDALGKLDKVREKTEASCRRQQDGIVELRQFEAERRAREQVSIERTQYINELRREVADTQVKLQNTAIDAALGARDARIERLETQLRMLLQFLSISGVDLPRGGF